MTNPAIVGCSTYRDNIAYVVEPLPMMDTFCKKISDDLKRLGKDYPKTVIFCRPALFLIRKKYFCSTEGHLHVIIATTAFRMGIDCPDIRMIYHWGPPATLEEYAQETGQAGRDTLLSKAFLFSKALGKFVSDDVKKYIENSSICRRKLMYEQFIFNESLHTQNGICCDICCKISSELV
uniref:DNA 3'-5' helicase n=1 Tax=Amphimedon queenslandica TaxID=400682 RepID=A0A1X7SWD6_AMPQE